MMCRMIAVALTVATVAACLSPPADANKSCTLSMEEWLALTQEQRAEWKHRSCEMVLIRAANMQRIEREMWREDMEGDTAQGTSRPQVPR